METDHSSMSIDYDAHAPSTETQSLNRDIELIYKALRDEREGGSASEGGSDEEEEDEVDDTDTKAGVQGQDGDNRDGSDVQEQDAAHAGESEIQLNIKDGSLSIDPETCLVVNRAYQEKLTDSIKRIELALAQNRERQRTLEEEIESGMNRSSKKTTSIIGYSIPYFKDAKGMYPPGNHDSLLKKLEYDPYDRLKRPWTEEDSEKLLKAIAADGLKRRIQPLMNRKELFVGKLSTIDDAEQKREIESKIGELSEEILRIRYTPTEKLIGRVDDDEELDKIDWMKISAFDFEGEFTEQYLIQAWQNLVHPSLNTEPWSTEEDECLYQLATEHQLRNWAVIAEKLQSRRSAFQCIHRFQTKLSPSLAMGRWLPEEDDFLKEMVESVMIGDYIPWHQVSEMMEGRSQEQCALRWKSLAKTKKKGRWTLEEDLKLVSAVHCYGRNWGKVYEFVPGRSRAQCRERWVNSMDEDLKYGNWTYEEDRKLVLLMAKYGEGCWTTVAKQLPGRTDNMVIQRYRRLCSWQKAEKTKLDTLKRQEQEGLKKTVVKDEREVVTQAKRVVEGALVEQAHIQEQQHQDLTTMTPSAEASEPIDEEGAPGPSIGTDSASSNPQENHSEAKKRRAQATQMLNKLARETVRQDRLESDREKELREEDLRNGLYVPRPQQNHTRKSESMEKRKTMNEQLIQYIRETLKTTAKGNPEQVYKMLEAHLEAQNIQVSTVGNMLSVAANIKKQMLSNQRSRRHAEIDEQLKQAVRERNATRQVGRPRNYHAANNTHKRSAEIEKKINTLMMTTLNVDKVSSLLVANSLKKANIEKRQKAARKNNENADSYVGQANVKRELEDAASVVQSRNTCVNRKRKANPPVRTVKAQKRWEAAEDDDVEVTVSDERDMRCSVSMKGGVDRDAAISVVNTLTVPLHAHSTLLPRVSRKRLIGRAEAMYDIPPLPPSTTTLQGFKGLLLNRRALLKNSGQGKEPSGAGPAASQFVRDTMEGLHSSDITPSVVKKLSTHFTQKDIMQAKELLEQKEAERRMSSGAASSAQKKAAKTKDARSQERCEEALSMARTSHDYHLLNARFHSLFLWPAMLSTFTVPTLGNPSRDTASTDNAQVTSPATKGKKKRKRMALTAGWRQRKEKARSRKSKEEIRQKVTASRIKNETTDN